MNQPPNLADPDFEPTDEQLAELSVHAFAGVGREHELALQSLRRQISTAKEKALRSLMERTAGGRDAP